MRPYFYFLTTTLLFLAGCSSSVHPESKEIMSVPLAARKSSVFDYPAHFAEIYNTQAYNELPKELDEYFNK